MQDFIRDAAAKLGIGEGQAASAAGGLFGLMKEHGDKADVSAMLQKLPGAQGLMDKAGGGGGGLLGGLGGLGGAAGGLLGGGAPKALGAAAMLSKTGLSADKLGSFMQLFTQYVQPLLGGDLLKRLTSKVPGLGDLIR